MASSTQRRAEVARQQVARQQAVAALRLGGVRHQRVIAERLGVDQATISRDLAALDELYRERAAEDIAAAKGEDLDRLDVLLDALWEQATGPKAKAHVVDRILAIMDRRAKLLGLDAPVKNEHSGADGGPIQHEVVDARERLKARITEMTTKQQGALPA